MANVKPLVKETLTVDDVEAIVKASDVKHPNFDRNNCLWVSKGWLTTWDGEYHVGYIIHHIHKYIAVSSMDVYFMEVEIHGNPIINGDKYVCNDIQYHKLLPISVLVRNKNDEKAQHYIPVTNIDTLVNRIVNNARDEWGLFPADASKPANDLTNSIKLEYNDIGMWSEPIPAEELEHIQAERKEEQERRERELIDRFSKGDLPEAEDDLWYAVLADVDSRGFGDTSLETKILKILQRRGINVYIDGERDSFGWVTRGIFIDGKIMCIY